MSSRVRDSGRVWIICAGLTLAAAMARAQEVPLPSSTVPSLLGAAPNAIVRTEPAIELRSDEAVLEMRPEISTRRGVLVPMYVSFASLQMLDAHSTLRAVRAGGVEQNPMLRGLADKPAALVALKAGVAVSAIALVDRVRVRSRLGSIVLMAALNSAYAVVVAHNYRTVP